MGKQQKPVTHSLKLMFYRLYYLKGLTFKMSTAAPKKQRKSRCTQHTLRCPLLPLNGPISPSDIFQSFQGTLLTSQFTWGKAERVQEREGGSEEVVINEETMDVAEGGEVCVKQNQRV